MIKGLWKQCGGPLKTPVAQEERIWDAFLQRSRELRMEFQRACNQCRARVVGAFHEDVLAETEEGEGDDESPEV